MEVPGSRHLADGHDRDKHVTLKEPAVCCFVQERASCLLHVLLNRAVIEVVKDPTCTLFCYWQL